MLDVFRGAMTPDACWDLLVHLPRDSALMASLADDPDHAPENAGPGEPSWTEFSPEAAVLADIYDMLGVLVRQVAGLAGKPPEIRPYPRPGDAHRKAAAERTRAQARVEWAELCARLGVT